MKRKNIIMLIGISIFSVINSTSIKAAEGTCPESVGICYVCFNFSCDTAIKGAMKQQKKTLANRLDDLIGVIQANIRQTKNQTVIIEKEILAYSRLRERIKMESTMLKEASHISNQIKDSSALGSQINIIQKGKL